MRILTDFLSGWNFVIGNAKMPPSRINLGGFLFQKKKKQVVINLIFTSTKAACQT